MFFICRALPLTKHTPCSTQVLLPTLCVPQARQLLGATKGSPSGRPKEVPLGIGARATKKLNKNKNINYKIYFLKYILKYFEFVKIFFKFFICGDQPPHPQFFYWYKRTKRTAFNKLQLFIYNKIYIILYIPKYKAKTLALSRSVPGGQKL